MTLGEALLDCPLVAILRGVTPDEIVPIGSALHEAGFRVVEIPLNSPQPLESVARLASAFAGRLVVGAGTVLTPTDVDAVVEAGGRMIVSPNANPAVISRAVAKGADPFPGFLTPTEAFAAIEAGATRLKLFPASTVGPAHLRALKAVLDPKIQVYPVGGVRPEDMKLWREAGASGFGLGSELYRPGQTANETLTAARRAIDGMRNAS